MVKIIKLWKTCFACPAQWEGKLDNGQYVYIRYRWGIFRVGIADCINDAINNSVCIEEIGSQLDGFMETKQMLKLVRKINIKASLPILIESHLPNSRL